MLLDLSLTNSSQNIRSCYAIVYFLFPRRKPRFEIRSRSTMKKEKYTYIDIYIRILYIWQH